MNKYELVRAMSKRVEGLTIPMSEKALNAFTDVILDELRKGERVHIVGFGTFETVKHAARIGRNIGTGEVLRVKPTRIPKFRASDVLKKAIKDNEV